MKKQFKYTTTFASEIRPLINDERDKFLSSASFEDFKSIVPKDLDLENADDILIFGAPGAVIGRANKNDDVISKEKGLKVYKGFIHRYINISHSSEIAGHIISTGFSKFNPNYKEDFTHKILSEEQVKEDTNPVNLVIAGILYRRVDDDLIDNIINAANEEAVKSMLYSLSWELGFSDYNIAVGSRNLSEAKIITDLDEIEKMSKELRINKGSGKYNGEPIYRNIEGTIWPMGFSLTSAPAAEIKGIHPFINNANAQVTCASCNKSFDYSKEPETSMNAVKCPNCQKTINQEGKLLAELNSFSQNQEISVNMRDNESNKNLLANRGIKMKKLKSIAELKELTQEDVKDVCIASLRDVVEDGINQASNKYAEQIKSEQKSKEEALQKAQAAETKVTELDKTVADANKKIEDLNKKVEQAEAKETQRAQDEAFQRHMTYISENYELNEKQSEAVASDIKDMDDKAFETWTKKFEVFAAKKAPKKDEKDMTPEEKKKMEKMMKDKMGAKASDEEVSAAIEKVFAELQKEDKPLPNARGTDNDDSSLKKSFSLGEDGGIEFTK